MIKLKRINLALGKQIFNDFNLSVGEGEKVLFCSPSGTGKSCLINIITGFLRPDEGSVEIGLEVMNKDSVARIRRKICCIAQEALLPPEKAIEVIKLIGEFKVNRHLDFKEDTILKLLGRFDLCSDTLQKNTETLSGGERQRLAFIICMLLDRDIWLLDEITAGLDRNRKKAIMDSVNSSHRTVIVASHDPDWREYGMREVIW